MRCHDAKRELSTQSGAPLAQPEEHTEDSQHASVLGTPPSRLYPTISTERIMQAVDRQRRITQQLDDLRAQHQQSNALLRTMGLQIIGWTSCALGTLVGVLTILFMLQPAVLTRMLTLCSGGIALVLAVGESVRANATLIPSNSWAFSGAALAVVLMAALWLGLMRHPREV